MEMLFFTFNELAKYAICINPVKEKYLFSWKIIRSNKLTIKYILWNYLFGFVPCIWFFFCKIERLLRLEYVFWA